MFENSNRRQFQKGLDAEKQRAIRRESQLSLRRQKREAHLQKRRRTINNNVSASNTTNGNQGERGEEESIPSVQDIPKYIVNVMQNENVEKQLIGTTAIRKLLSIERDPPTRRIVKSCVVPKIIQFMISPQQYNEGSDNNNSNKNNPRHQDILSQLQFEAAWVVTNIAASTTEFTRYICQHGAIEGFVDLFRNTRAPEVADQAIWGLGNIAGDGKDLRDRILQTGFVNDLISCLSGSNFNDDLQRNAVWVISNIFRYNDPLKVQDICNVVPVLNKLLRESKDQDVIRDCLWCFNYLSANQSEGIVNYLVNNSSIIHDCIKLLQQEAAKYEIALNQMRSKEKKQAEMNSFLKNTNGNPDNTKDNEPFNITKAAMLKMSADIYRPCLRFIGNILSEADELTQCVLNAGYLDVIEPWANHFLSAQRKEIMWSFSNILAGSHQQIEALLSRPNLIRAIIGAGLCGKLAVKREAVWCICNAISESITAQKKVLADNGAIEVLCSMLKPEYNINESQLQIVIEGLEGFLAVYGSGSGSFNPYANQVEELKGLDYLEDRQGDQNLSEETYQMIVDLVKKYWDSATYCEGDMVPNGEYVLGDKLQATVDTNTNQFAFGFAKGNVTQSENIGNMNNGFSAQNNVQYSF